VLSHGHYDHSGGIQAAWDLSPGARLYLHPDAVKPKYTYDKRVENVRYIGLSAGAIESINTRSDLVRWNREITEVLPGVFITGEIPRVTEFEKDEAGLYADPDCAVVDPLMDDQALFFTSRDGVVVLLGCAHAGVINTLEHIRKFVGATPIHSVLGGLHLVTATPERVQRTIERLEQMQVKRLGPMHCTGWEASASLFTALPKVCFRCHTGMQIGYTMPG
jgi:7,8-dihydropterin-6-yl-methyl-4-(beta-D-ribofuranosyl)aminobenzene 5'-phosphate synthase